MLFQVLNHVRAGRLRDVAAAKQKRDQSVASMLGEVRHTDKSTILRWAAIEALAKQATSRESSPRITFVRDHEKRFKFGRLGKRHAKRFEVS